VHTGSQLALLHGAMAAAVQVKVPALTSDSSVSSVGTAVRSKGDSGGTRAYSAAAPRTAAKQTAAAAEPVIVKIRIQRVGSIVAGHGTQRGCGLNRLSSSCCTV